MSIFDDDYTSTTVPVQILDLPIKDNLIYVDVLNVGRKVGVTLDEQAAEDKGLVKNHWIWRVLLDGPGGLIAQLQFSFNLKETPSVASDVAQYGGSSRSGGSSIGDRDTSSNEAGVHADVESVLEKPTTIHIGSLWAEATQLSVTDENSAQPIAPSILSSTGNVIDQPTEGAPTLGSLDIKAHPRADRSLRAYFTRSFTLAANTTFGQLLEAMTTRKMEPFMFRKIGTAYLGCRDGISQAAAAWHADNLLTDMVCIEQPRKHLFDLIPWKYSWPIVSADLSDEDIEDPNPPLIRGLKTTVSWIDRAWWPKDYVHFEHEKLLFNQPANN